MSLLDNWSQIKVIIDNLEFDVVKNHKGNVSAGCRLRKALRLLKKLTLEMIIESRDRDRDLRRLRVETRVQLTPEQKARRYATLKRKREAQIAASKSNKKK